MALKDIKEKKGTNKTNRNLKYRPKRKRGQDNAKASVGPREANADPSPTIPVTIPGIQDEPPNIRETPKEPGRIPLLKANAIRSTPSSDEINWAIGGTFSITKGYDAMFQDARDANANVIQFFISKSNQWPSRIIGRGEKEAFDKAVKSANWKRENLIIHGHLHLNLASKNKATYDRCLRLFRSEVEACATLGVPFYVLHPGSPKKEMSHTEAIKQTANAVKEAAKAFPTVKILVENMAGQGDVIGSTLDEIGELVRKTDDLVGVCVDTQHLWAAGYDVTEWEKFMREFDTKVGLQHLQLIHLNNSSVPFHSKKDSHARMGEGTIPMKAIKEIIQDPRLKKVPFVLEIIHSEDPKCVNINREEINSLNSVRNDDNSTHKVLWQQDMPLFELQKRIQSMRSEDEHSVTMPDESVEERATDTTEITSGIGNAMMLFSQLESNFKCKRKNRFTSHNIRKARAKHQFRRPRNE